MPTTYFTEDHEWLRVEGGIATVGITDYAQEQLGDLVFVELPEAGPQLRRATRRSWSNPSRRPRTSMRRSTARSSRPTRRWPATRRWSIPPPTGDGWLWKMRLADESQLEGLMDEAGYKAHDRLKERIRMTTNNPALPAATSVPAPPTSAPCWPPWRALAWRR